MGNASSALKVLMNGELVGIWEKAANGAESFTYDKAWLNNPMAVPLSLSLPIRPQPYSGNNVTSFFDNLLPDNIEIRRQIAARMKAKSDGVYHLLSVVGRDCVGALQFCGVDEDLYDIDGIQAQPVSNVEIRDLLAGLARAPLGLDWERDFRISLAGAQEKTALLWHDNQWHLPKGATPTTHILKPAIGNINGINLSRSVENEFLCLKLLDALAISVASAEMADFEGISTLVIERFDRFWYEDDYGYDLYRLPQEDCCQALGFPSTKKYQSDGGPGMVDILKLLSNSDDPDADQRIFLKTVICFWLMGATDGHAKNFSIMLGAGGTFQLAPIYDVLSLQPAIANRDLPWNQYKLAMSVGDKKYAVRSVCLRHFIETAAKANVGKKIVESIFEEVRDDLDTAINAVAETGVALDMLDIIGDAMRKRAKDPDTIKEP